MKPNKNMNLCSAGNDLVFLCGVLCFLLSFGLGNGADVWAAVEKTSAETPGNYANEQKLAVKNAEQSYPFIEKVKKEDPVLRKIRLHNMGLNTEDIEHDYFLLSSPLVNTYEDMYEPVRFMHSKHAASLNNNCAACHHYRPQDPELPEIMPCRSCHQKSFQPEHPKRLGLKAAYHQQCIGCHQDMNKGPTDCLSCHRKNPTDHEYLVQLPDNPGPRQVTAECLRCHEDEARDFIHTAHWLWKGPAQYTVKRQKEAIGKGTIALNNF